MTQKEAERKVRLDNVQVNAITASIEVQIKRDVNIVSRCSCVCLVDCLVEERRKRWGGGCSSS